MANLYPHDCSSFLVSLEKYISETKSNHFYLTGDGMGATELVSILGFITSCDSEIIEFSLKRFNFEDGIEQSIKTLVQTNIKELRISSAKLSVDDFLCLMEVLKNTQITSLDVRKNGIKLDRIQADKFTSHLLESQLTRLNFTGNEFEPAIGALSFILALPHTSITELKLKRCNLQADVVTSLFLNIHRTAITELDLRFNKITDSQMERLWPNLKVSKLEKLNLRGNVLTDVGINFLSAGLGNSSVVHLSVADNAFFGKNSFGRCLSETKIQVLDISRNKIRSEKMFSFPNFVKESSVKTLDISYCGIGDIMGQKIVESLKFSNVNVLHAVGNQLGNLTLEEIFDSVDDTKLTTIDLTDNALPSLELITSGTCFKMSRLTQVFLGRFPSPLGMLVITHFLACCMTSSHITHVGLTDCGVFEEDVTLLEQNIEVIASILGKTSILALMFDCNKIGKSVLRLAEHLKFSAIAHLDLSSNRIQDAGAEALANCLKETQLVDLDLRNNFITSRGASALALALKGSNLIQLVLSNNKIKNDGFEALAKGVKGSFVFGLDVSRNPGKRIFLIKKELLENQIIEARLIYFLKLIANQNGTTFCFENFDNFDTHGFLEDILLVCKTLSEHSAVVSVLIRTNNISLSKADIVKWMSEEFPKQLSTFVASRADVNISELLSFLRRAEDLGLSKIVECLLLNRPMYLIDENLGILHPFIYKLLFKYKQPLYSLALEPQVKSKIITYFRQHNEYPDASDLVHLLINE